MIKSLIFGITGQTASYLAELLLEKNHEVFGVIRRGSTINTQRINHLLYPETKIHLFYGDLGDTNSIYKILMDTRPDEIYNAASMSHVRVSFDIPEYSFDITGTGVMRLLESIKNLRNHDILSKKVKFLQFSSSEMFGLSPPPQNENTPFIPVSPYGISKLAGYYAQRAYRIGYSMFACGPICFNNESIPKYSPLIIKDKDGFIDVKPIEDLFRTNKHKYEGILDEFKGIYVWNGLKWSKIIDGSCYQDKNKKLKLIQTRKSSYESTLNHISYMEDGKEIETGDWKIGNSVFEVNYPKLNSKLSSKYNKDFAYFLGYLVGDGHIDKRGRIRITGIDKNQLISVANLIINQYGWSYRLNTWGCGHFNNCRRDIWQLDINNDTYFGLWLRKEIYTKRNLEKRIPRFILNSDVEVQKAFFDGYYLADGRQSGHESYKYKGFTTNSETLSLGLNFIFKSISNQITKTKCEIKNGKRYYYTQIRGNPNSNLGNHLKKKLNEIIKIIDIESDDGWFYDIQTETEDFATGSNLFRLHNSPRRGKTFVTMKIVEGAVRIKLGLQDKIALGNLDAMRDWGFSKDYCDCIYKIMHHIIPDDFIVATEEYHSVREFAERVFKKLNLDINDHIIIEDKYRRPNEVPELRGDASKAHDILGWKPIINFNQLVDLMVDSVMKEEKNAIKLKEST